MKKNDEKQVLVALYLGEQEKKPIVGKRLDPEEQLQDYCRIMDWHVVRIYRDESLNEKKKNRAVVQDMLLAAKRGEFHKVVMLQLDKISRSLHDLLLLMEELDKYDVSLVCIKDNIDTSLATGKFVRMALDMVARFEIEAVSGASYEAKHELTIKGRFAGGTIPYGYRYGYCDCESETKVFEINEEQADEVEGIFKDYVGGKTMYQIAKDLNDRGVKTNRNGIWQQNTVKLILENPFYTGRVKWEGIVNKGTHESIISDRLFNKAQDRLNETKC